MRSRVFLYRKQNKQSLFFPNVIRCDILMLHVVTCGTLALPTGISCIFRMLEQHENNIMEETYAMPM